MIDDPEGLLAELRAMEVDPEKWDRQTAAEQRRADSKAAACDGKVKHPTEQAARHAAWLRRWTVGWYRCRYCHDWHVG